MNNRTTTVSDANRTEFSLRLAILYLARVVVTSGDVHASKRTQRNVACESSSLVTAGCREIRGGTVRHDTRDNKRSRRRSWPDGNGNKTATIFKAALLSAMKGGLDQEGWRAGQGKTLPAGVRLFATEDNASRRDVAVTRAGNSSLRQLARRRYSRYAKRTTRRSSAISRRDAKL